MGVIKRGILGGFSGSVGNVVGSSWKGIATMKAKPLSVANPNTAGQVAQRSKMSNLVAFAKQILTAIIKPLNDRFASGMSGFNLFTQRNIDLFAAALPSPVANLVLSRGNVQAPVIVDITGSNNTDTLAILYDDSLTGNALATDVLYVVAQNRATGEIAISNDTPRSDGSVGAYPQFETNLVTGQNIDVWMSYRRADGTQVSDTTYGTTVVIP